MKFLRSILLFLCATSVIAGDEECKILPKANCVSFNVSPGTGCAWMCNYCQDQLGTTNYYFTDGVCTYQEGGCQGNPMAGVTYTCCSS